MDKSKAKKAKSKATKAKAKAQNAAAVMAAQAQQSGSAAINPEIQASTIALQPQAVNPYHRMGAMPPTMYSAGNLVGGNTLPLTYNPEA
jgi:phage/plasmid primase-like uncharacterized protein